MARPRGTSSPSPPARSCSSTAPAWWPAARRDTASGSLATSRDTRLAHARPGAEFVIVGLAAVEDEFGAIGVGAVVGGEPERELGDLVGARVAAEWNTGRHRVEGLVGHHRRVDDPRVDGVHPHAVRPELSRGALGHPAHRPLGRAVREAGRRAAQSADRRDVDDRAAAAVRSSAARRPACRGTRRSGSRRRRGSSRRPPSSSSSPSAGCRRCSRARRRGPGRPTTRSTTPAHCSGDVTSCSRNVPPIAAAVASPSSTSTSVR